MARGIFVTVEYKGDVVKGKIMYSFKFLNFNDLFWLYKIPFYLIEDFKKVNLKKSFKVKFYGQSFYPFRYFSINNENKSNLNKNSSMNNNFNSYDDIDFFEYYFKIFDKNLNFYILDMVFKSLFKEYSNIPSEARKSFISEFNLFFNFSKFNYKNW